MHHRLCEDRGCIARVVGAFEVVGDRLEERTAL